MAKKNTNTPCSELFIEGADAKLRCILKHLADAGSEQEALSALPELKEKDIQAAISFAAAAVLGRLTEHATQAFRTGPSAVY